MDNPIQKNDKTGNIPASSKDATGINRKIPNQKKNLHDIPWYSEYTTYDSMADCAAFSLDGKTIASAKYKQIRLWDSTSGKCLRTLTGHSGDIYSVAFKSDNKILASGSIDSTIKIWDVSSGECLETLSGHSEIVYSVAFSNDGKYLASGSGDKSIRIWIFEVNSWKPYKTLSGNFGEELSVSFSNNGRFLASGDGILRLWDTSDWKFLWSFDDSDEIYSVSFSPDSKTIAGGNRSGSIFLWKINKRGRPKLDWYYLEENYSKISSVGFSYDGKTFISSGFYHTRLWNVESAKLIRSLQESGVSIHSFVCSPTSNILILVDDVGKLIFWDLVTFSQLATNHNLYKGFLYATPPDDYYPEALFWTDRFDLITVFAEKPDGTREVASDKERDCYIDTHNRKLLVQARLCGDLKTYEDLTKGAHIAIEGYNKQKALECKYFHRIAIEAGNPFA